MDRVIAKWHSAADGDLVICPDWGVAYQRDMSQPVHYNGEYFDKYVHYEDTPLANAINAGRVALVNKHVGPEAGVLDVGIGSGEFIKKRPNTFGYDINPKAVEWLKANMRYSDSFAAFDGFTFWDVLEHVENPAEDYLDRIHDGACLFTSIPVFADLTKIRQSKHYRPNEHFYYFTRSGFIHWMAKHGFRCLETDDFETRAGREAIMSFAFKRG